MSHCGVEMIRSLRGATPFFDRRTEARGLGTNNMRRSCTTNAGGTRRPSLTCSDE